MKYFVLLILLIFTVPAFGQLYSTISGKVNFVSDAPLELIEASSDQMQGILDLTNKTFAFKMYIKSFQGFNNPLQQEHFYENYMETDEYPIGVFKGKLLEDIQQGKRTYRAKGSLDLHGISIERIINVELEISDQLVNYSSSFSVPLVDHDIELPRIVYQKIAEEIMVEVDGSMRLKQ